MNTPPITVTINPDGTVIRTATHTNLTHIRRTVGGPAKPICSDQWVAFINENGKTAGLPRNQVATDFFESVGVYYGPGEWVAGVAIILGWAPSTDQFVDVPEHVHDPRWNCRTI